MSDDKENIHYKAPRKLTPLKCQKNSCMWQKLLPGEEYHTAERNTSLCDIVNLLKYEAKLTQVHS